MTDYGTDLSSVFVGTAADLDPSGAEVSGRLCLAQSLARRFVTPRGRLIDDPNYGFYLPGFLNDDLGAGDLAQIRAGIENECQKDERVVSAQASVVFQSGALTATIVINDGTGPFSLVLAVTSISAQLLVVGQ